VNRTLPPDLRRFGPERIRELEGALRTACAPPAAWFADRDLFHAERDLVLRKSWRYASHIGQLKNIGDQIVDKIDGVPIVIVRDEQNEIRGFVNICRHRAHFIVLENQNQRSMQCLYHGWTYGLDGCLRAAPRSRTDPSFDAKQFPLLKIQVHCWGPTIWVNLDLGAPDFDAWAAGLPALVEEHGVHVDDHRPSFDKTWTIRANWKLFLDNAIERHCTIDPPSRAARRNANLLHGAGHTAIEGERLPCFYHWIFPTTVLGYADDLRGFEIGSVRPLDGDRIEFKNTVFVRNDMSKETESRRRSSYERDPAVDEDAGICERAQQALAHAPGRLLPASEWLIRRLRQAPAGPGNMEVIRDGRDNCT
jgi:nitrite reductase/ring-hydroxylating ferredoxin subunit